MRNMIDAIIYEEGQNMDVKKIAFDENKDSLTIVYPVDLETLDMLQHVNLSYFDELVICMQGESKYTFVQRNKGEWVRTKISYGDNQVYGYLECSQCAFKMTERSNFCPYCGSDMR